MSAVAALDPQSLRELGELIIGDGGPKYRRGWELPQFFRDCGLDTPDHAGESRRDFVHSQLEAISGDPAKLERVILRLADPREYGAANSVHEEAVQALNALLEPELLHVVIDGRRPRLEGLDDVQTRRIVPRETPPMASICSEPRLAELLEERWHEAERCLGVSSYLSALVMMGSLLEGALYAWITEHRDAAIESRSVPHDPKTKQPLPFSRWSLSDLINVGFERGWIQEDIKDFSHVLREYRNLVHPAKQRDSGASPDEDTCLICWEVVRAALNDLAAANEAVQRS
jgi:hypothetical protein